MSQGKTTDFSSREWEKARERERERGEGGRGRREGDRRLRIKHIQHTFFVVLCEHRGHRRRGWEGGYAATQIWCLAKIKEMDLLWSWVMVVELSVCVMFSLPLQRTGFFASKYKMKTLKIWRQIFRYDKSKVFHKKFYWHDDDKFSVQAWHFSNKSWTKMDLPCSSSKLAILENHNFPWVNIRFAVVKNLTSDMQWSPNKIVRWALNADMRKKTKQKYRKKITKRAKAEGTCCEAGRQAAACSATIIRPSWSRSCFLYSSRC